MTARAADETENRLFILDKWRLKKGGFTASWIEIERICNNGYDVNLDIVQTCDRRTAESQIKDDEKCCW